MWICGCLGTAKFSALVGVRSIMRATRPVAGRPVVASKHNKPYYLALVLLALVQCAALRGSDRAALHPPSRRRAAPPPPRRHGLTRRSSSSAGAPLARGAIPPPPPPLPASCRWVRCRRRAVGRRAPRRAVVERRRRARAEPYRGRRRQRAASAATAAGVGRDARALPAALALDRARDGGRDEREAAARRRGRPRRDPPRRAHHARGRCEHPLGRRVRRPRVGPSLAPVVSRVCVFGDGSRARPPSPCHASGPPPLSPPPRAIG